MSRTVEVRVAGQNYRVVSSAPEEEVRRLAAVVNAKLAEVAPKGGGAHPQAILLAAMSLAHQVEAERQQRVELERRTRDFLRRTLRRVDDALGRSEEEPPAEHESAD
jgi:cell division protein ZapA